jgi:putative phosphoesterase
MKLLLLSDIHANFPALQAIADHFSETSFDCICNCGDSLVYAPFPNETLHWLQAKGVISIVGNTDRKIRKLLRGKSFKKPRKAEKRIMYTWTAEQLDPSSRAYLLSLKKTKQLQYGESSIGLYHGSPEDPDEFLFPDTKPQRFKELSHSCPNDIVITGHSHMPFHVHIHETHFINPGSVGRMFDGTPHSSCAVLNITGKRVETHFFRIPYDIELTVSEIKNHQLPTCYEQMYRMGRKLN